MGEATVNIHDFDGLYRKLQEMQHGVIEKVIRNIVEALGETLLNELIEEIGRQDLIDTGTLWNSFTRGDEENVWEWDIDRNAITLEVGSNLSYARYLNDGYTIEKTHFVPGYWNSGGSFIYAPSAKTGFMARPRTFIGRTYFDITVQHFEGGMNELIVQRLEKELGRGAA
ncbi:HK97 gp10 family phage protein [Aneurinibacillus sp. XH2]|jgi:hypothetical protein|uniref:HK97 gp10 family phage protein n=1 Tax=Aneurinibacillus sp. XH2 TaxID=1450761 RepID=UPI000B2104A6|nr:HK97 gp10 family phage protein [Aneurinibacillus sp. XH2]